MFSETLEISLSLEISGKLCEIPGGNVQLFELDLYPYGFRGRVGFGVLLDATEVDELFEPFITHDLITVQFQVNRTDDLLDDSPKPVSVKGLVTEKSMRETEYKEVKKEKVLCRYYEVWFQDGPSMLWRQHYPVALYTEKTIADVVKEQVAENILFEIEKGILEDMPDMVFLGLEKRIEGPCFYDFLMWLSWFRSVVPVYDYEAQKLKLIKTKKDADLTGEVDNFLYPNEVDDILIQFPETVRHDTRLLNAYFDPEMAQTIDKFQDQKLDYSQAAEGITQDIVLRTPREEDLDKRKELETNIFNLFEEKLLFEMDQFPSRTCLIGYMLKLDENHWAKDRFIFGKKYRVYEIHMSGKAEDENLSGNYNNEYAKYNMEMSIRLEPETCPQIHFPTFKSPNYPVFVEGKIVSEVGEETDKTYQFYNNDTTSQDEYTVYVPLWDLNIKAPFVPGIFTGHFYFPAFRDARVLLALYFDHAEILRFLDWGQGSRLPMDTQGNHILFGKNADSQTSMRHVYDNGKPELTIERTSDKDTELIQIKEETIIIQTRDKEE